MSDLWFYKQGGATHGPISSQELGLLALTGGLAPTDLIWPEGIDLSGAVLAEAALAFPRVPAAAPEGFRAAPPPVPDWLPELAAAFAAVKDLTALPPPPPEAWIPDVRRAEGAMRPAGTGPNAPGHE